MLFETHVLGGDKSVDHVGRHGIVVGIYTVARAVVIAAQLRGSIGGVNERCKFVVRIFELLDRGHVAYYAVIDKEQKDKNEETESQK